MQEFDIILKSRLTECDIIIYSLPYREGLVFTHQLLLDQWVSSYTLRKLNKSQSNLAVISEVGDTFKISYEKADATTAVVVNGDLSVHYVVDSEGVCIPIITEDLISYTKDFVCGESVTTIVCDEAVGSVKKPFGAVSHNVFIATSLDDGLKTSSVTILGEVAVVAELADGNKVGCLEETATVPVVAELENLFYRKFSGGEANLCIVIGDLDGEIRHSLGAIQSTLFVDATMGEDDIASKFEKATSVLGVCDDVTETVVQCLSCEDAVIAVDVTTTDYVLKRHRLLSELDDETLASIGDKTLEELSYVIIEQD